MGNNKTSSQYFKNPSNLNATRSAEASTYSSGSATAAVKDEINAAAWQPKCIAGITAIAFTLLKEAWCI